MAIQLGPILRLHSASASEWVVSVMYVLDATDPAPNVKFAVPPGAGLVDAGNAELLHSHPANQPKLKAWKSLIKVVRTVDEQEIGYGVSGGVRNRFFVPAKGSSPKFAYASCNGFSDPKAMKKVTDKNALWADLMRRHEGETLEPHQPKQAYHALLMGGDQIYSDSMWEVVPALKAWLARPMDKRFKAEYTNKMKEAVENFYFKTYIERWSQPEPAAALASIPTAMMWDDHDIFDGWGSYPAAHQASPVFQGIFAEAKRCFSIFQLHTVPGASRSASVGLSAGFSYGYDFGDIAVLALDMRSERDWDQVIGFDTWETIYKWMYALPEKGHLLVMSSIPVIHPTFALLERLLGALPGQQELEDDLKDHWHSRSHCEERVRLIHRLLDFSAAKNRRVTLLSGDVHVGAIGVLESTRHNTSNAQVINQLTSSGIVHPAPPAIALYFLESAAKAVDQVDRGITAAMYEFPGTNNRFIGKRNWLSLEPDSKARIWANWFVEGESRSFTKVIHAVQA